MRTKIINTTVVTGYVVLENCGITISDCGKIEEIFNMKRYVNEKDSKIYDAQGLYVCPGLIDTHIHGIEGFGTEDISTQSILGMSESLVKYGITSFLPTVYPQSPEKLYASEHAISDAMGKENGATIVGINLEGPFVSPERPGALPPQAISLVDIDYFDRIVKEGQGNIVCMSVAPELKHMRSLALKALSENIVLLAGHTNAKYENIIEGMQCGIMHSTHFFNAMSRLHHRNPGVVGAVLIQRDMCCEIIADGVHVHPELVKLLLREKPVENVVLVTDSLKPTNQKNRPYFANGVEVIHGEGGAFVSAENPNLLNGSALTLNRAVGNIVNWGVSIEDAVKMATENPARIYNMKSKGQIKVGTDADIAVFDENFDAKLVLIQGVEKFNTL